MFHLIITTPEKRLFEDEHVVSLVVPTVNGEIGVLTGHHPIVAQLTLGAIKIGLANETEQLIFIGSGYLEVNNNQATILADQAENVEEIALEQVKEARRKAEEQLKTAKDQVEMDKYYEELKTQLLREQLAGIAKFKKEQK